MGILDHFPLDSDYGPKILPELFKEGGCNEIFIRTAPYREHSIALLGFGLHWRYDACDCTAPHFWTNSRVMTYMMASLALVVFRKKTSMMYVGRESV